MAIDSRYIPAFTIETVILDKDTGQPLSGGIVTFEQANQPGVLKPVWQITNTSGNYTYVQLPNPMILSSIGTFQDALDNPVVPYFLPEDGDGNPEYYRVIVESSGLVPQFVRDPVPYLGNAGGTTINASTVTNELSNPQFADVLFDTDSASYVYNFTAAALEVVNIAPNWDIVVSGTGTVTVSQTRPLGSLNRPSNPGTLLNIRSTGISFLRLRQRLYGSPNLFGSGYISGYFVGKTFAGTSSSVTMFYSQSNGLVINQPVLLATLPADGSYAEFSGNVLLGASTSAQNFPDAYVDIEIEIPLETNIEITSVQVVGTGDSSAIIQSYNEDTNNRQLDYDFHYYKPQLDFKPIPSLLTAWDFPLNPAQPLGSSVTMTTTAAYLWDQTIGQSVVGNIAVERNGVTGGIQATTANADEAFYFIQYLSGAQAKEIIGTKLSVNINAFRTQSGGDCTVRVYLYRATAGASFPILPTSLGNIAASGVFTLTAANWALIQRGNLGQAQGTLSVVDTADYTTINDVVDLKFSGWEIIVNGEIADTDKFAIVVTYSCPTTGTVVVTNSVSLVKGDIPTRPAPQTADDVLRECQYYYEDSKNTGVLMTTSSAGGALLRQQAVYEISTTLELWPRTFGIEFNSVKVTASSIVSIFSEGGTADNVTAFIAETGAVISTSIIPISLGWLEQKLGNKGIQYMSIYANNTTGFITSPPTVLARTAEAYISFHYRVDARIGIVPI